jgi:hypothetical protein
MMVDLVAAGLDRVHERIAGRFGRAEPRARVREYVSGLAAGLERKNGWTLAEWAGEVSPDGMQRLLRWADWDVDGVRGVFPAGRAMTKGRLPDEGPARLGPVTLPAGRLIMGSLPREQVAWATVDPVPGSGRVWAALDWGVALGSRISDPWTLAPNCHAQLPGEVGCCWTCRAEVRSKAERGRASRRHNGAHVALQIGGGCDRRGACRGHLQRTPAAIPIVREG